jgi:hypothetical protein
MLTPRLLTLTLLLSVIPPAHAQSANTPAPPRITHPRIPLESLAPMQFGAAPARPASPLPAPLPNPFKPTPSASFTLPQPILDRLSRNTLLSPLPLLIARLQAAGRLGLLSSRRDNICLDLRSYAVAPDTPGSDSTHLTGSSTCQPASNFTFKSAVDPHPLLLR